MSIDEFRATIAATDIARPNKFEMSVFLPDTLGGATNRNINLRVKTIDMPGRNIDTTTNDTIYGPTHELAVGLTYADEITATFHLSPDFNEKIWFDRWQELIYDPKTYTLKFYKEYVSTMEIYQLNYNNERTYGVKLIEVFPKTIGAVTYSNETASGLQELSVGFAFKEWEQIEVSSGSSTRGKPTSTSDNLVSILKPSKPKLNSDPKYTPNRYSTPEDRSQLQDLTVDTIG